MAAEKLTTDWSVEEVPNTDSLYKRVHRKLFKADGTVMTGAFNHFEMSVDWSKYATPLETRKRSGNPLENAVARLSVAEVRKISGQVVKHSPDREQRNRAHSLVIGKKTEEARVKFRRVAELILPLTT